MSFVSRLRMANMFPTDLGNARINTGNDDMYEVIEAAKNLYQWNRGMNPPENGLQRVAQASRMPMQNPGGMPNVVMGPSSNPGADILARSKVSGDALYESYNQPKLNAGEVLAGSGLKPNDQQLEGRDTIDRDLERDVKRSQIARNTKDNSRLKVVNITDPNDPTKQISANYDEDTGQVTPIKLDGGKIQPGASAKVNAEDVAKNELKSKSRELQKSKAQDALTLLDELMDEQGNLKPDTQTATGYSANMPFLEKMPFGVGTSAATGNAKINKLQGQLTLDLIRELKEQSKTGATGFGQLNLRELGVLENSASMLSSRNMDEKEFARELGKIRERLKLIMQDKTDPGQIKPVSSHESNTQGKIRVRNKETGQTGTMSASAFNPAKYERVQ